MMRIKLVSLSKTTPQHHALGWCDECALNRGRGEVYVGTSEAYDLYRIFLEKYGRRVRFQEERRHMLNAYVSVYVETVIEDEYCIDEWLWRLGQELMRGQQEELYKVMDVAATAEEFTTFATLALKAQPN